MCGAAVLAWKKKGAHASFTEHPIGTAFALLLAVVVAYSAYATRKWLRDDPAKKQLRLPVKTPIERSRRQQDLFALFAGNQPPQHTARRLSPSHSQADVT